MKRESGRKRINTEGILLVAALFSMVAPLRSQVILAEYAEIFLTNNTTSDVSVTVAPIGMIFNDKREYSLTSSSSHEDFPNKPITGITDVGVSEGFQLYPVVNHIGTLESYSGGFLSTEDHIGYGKYRVIVTGWGYVDVDFSDFDYPYASGLNNDIFLRLEPSDRLYWEGGPDYLLTPNQDLIQIWDQTDIGGSIKNQNKDGFKIPNISESNPATNIPLGNHTDRGKLFVNADVLSNVTIINDITVANGAWLKIQQPGTQVKFNSGKKLTIDGKITAQGTTANRITFTRNGVSGNWGGIKINSGSSSNVSTLQRCDITYATSDVNSRH